MSPSSWADIRTYRAAYGQPKIVQNVKEDVRKIERQADRQTERQTDKQTERQTDKHSDIQTERLTKVVQNVNTMSKIERQTHRQKDR